MRDLLLFLALLILIIVLGWHIIFALVGGVIVVGATIWIFAIISVAFFSIAILLLFLFTIPGIVILAVIVAIWTILAIILFPILFPILLPLLIIFGFIYYTRRRNIQKK